MVGIAIAELAKQVRGQLQVHADLDGHGDSVQGAACGSLEVFSAVPLSQAKAGCITLIDDIKHAEKLASTQASAVVTPEAIPGLRIPQIVVEKPHEAFSTICKRFKPPVVLERSYAVHPTAIIDPSVKLDPATFIDSGVSIDADCVVGAGCHLHRGVTLMPGCKLGRDCQLFPDPKYSLLLL